MPIYWGYPEQWNMLLLAPLVTHRLPIRDAQKAFEIYERHEDGILKAVLDATDW
jgi:threonine dehydrogenase-like Zn-dependent dehydrogenase